MNCGDEPAFPEVDTDRDFDPPIISSSGGLTKREYFAGLAMQGILAKMALFEDDQGTTCRAAPEGLATASVEFADALLAELAKKGK